MNDIDTNELRKLAEAATPGPWQYDGCTIDTSAYVEVVSATCKPCDYSGCSGARLDMRQEDGEYIAAANPTTILALLDRLKAAEVPESQLVEHALGDPATSNRELRKMLYAVDKDRIRADERVMALTERAEKAESWVLDLREAVETAVDFAAVVLGTRPRSTIDDERPKDYVSRHLAEALDTLRTRLATIEARDTIESLRTDLAAMTERAELAEAEVKRLREAMPGVRVRSAILTMRGMTLPKHVLLPSERDAVDIVEQWVDTLDVTRLDAARGGAK